LAESFDIRGPEVKACNLDERQLKADLEIYYPSLNLKLIKPKHISFIYSCIIFLKRKFGYICLVTLDRLKWGYELHLIYRFKFSCLSFSLFPSLNYMPHLPIALYTSLSHKHSSIPMVMHHRCMSQPRSRLGCWLISTTALSVLVGLPASAIPMPATEPATEVVERVQDGPSLAFSSLPRDLASPAKSTVVKLPAHGSGMPHLSNLLPPENVAFSGQPIDVAHSIDPNQLATAPSLPNPFSYDAADLQGAVPEVAVGSVTLPPSSEAAGAIAQAEETYYTSDNYNLTAASQNPIANLIKLPFQNNTTLGVGPFDRTQNVLNIQPVYPVPLSEDVLLVTRTIVPLVAQPDIGGGNHVWGLGDINPSFFFVPLRDSNVTWGAGPTFLLPTATDTQTGTGKWGVGPAGIVAVNSPPWVFGGLLSQVWSFAGDGDRADVSQLTLQPYVNYNLPNGWYLTSAPLITANWNVSGEKWTLPIGGGFGRVFNLGSQPVNASAQVYWNAIAPEGAGDITLRFSLSLLFAR
jgi:hypothetical protein